MTVSSTSSRVVYAGNGSTTVFPFAFKVTQAADLVVVYTDATGGDITLSPSQYSASGFGLDAGGSVTYPTVASGNPAIASGTRLTIYRDVAVTQPTSISNQGAMWPQVIESALDRLTYVAQRVSDAVSRSLVISPTDSSSLNALPNATTRANSVLAFNASGQPYAATLTGSLVSVATWLVSSFFPLATSAANARTAIGAVGLTGDDTIIGTKMVNGTINAQGGTITVQNADIGDSTHNAASTFWVNRALGGTALRSYLAGLALANNSGTPNSKIDVAAGVCADSSNAQMLVVSAGTIDCATADANGLDTGSLANTTWYHVFAIGKADGTTALLASTSATAPTMPSGYTLKRRLGSFRTDGSAHIIPFSQSGDRFLWVTPVSVISDAGVAFPTSPSNLTMVVPTGVVVDAIFSAALGSVTVQLVVFSSIVQTGATPGTMANVTAHDRYGTLYATMRTDTSGRIQWISAGAGSSQTRIISTHGWIDRRGRDD